MKIFGTQRQGGRCLIGQFFFYECHSSPYSGLYVDWSFHWILGFWYQELGIEFL
jgi:hypothetical protein